MDLDRVRVRRSLRGIDAKASLAQLKAGGLPLRAELRLQDEAGASHKLFTSDLSVNELLLTREAGCTPISQVMGSSIYHIGRIADYKGRTGEMTKLSDAHRESRRLAVGRLALEAKAVGADAVVGVHLRERLITKGAHGKGGDDGDEVIEFTVVGTAVRAPFLDRPQGAEPVLTDLSGQDFWALVRAGFEPCGFFFDFCRYHVWHVMKGRSAGTSIAQLFGFSGATGEITAGSDAVETARDLVEQRVLEQARAAGAEFVVGSDIQFEVEEVHCGWHECELNDLDIDVSWFGTGVRRIPGRAQVHKVDPPPLVLGMMRLGRKERRDIVEGEEDESDELKREGKEDEDRAAERDGE